MVIFDLLEDRLLYEGKNDFTRISTDMVFSNLEFDKIFDRCALLSTVFKNFQQICSLFDKNLYLCDTILKGTFGWILELIGELKVGKDQIGKDK